MRIRHAVGVVCMFAVVQGKGQAIDLTPSGRFFVPALVGRDSQDVRVREMKAGGDGLWFLAETVGRQSGSVIVKSTFAGRVAAVIPLPADARPQGLAPTAAGVATLYMRQRGVKLAEFTVGGGRSNEKTIPCSMAGGLFSIWGKPGTVCSDGRILVHSASEHRDYSSWARPGALPLDLGDGSVALIDQVTSEILIEDLASGETRPLMVRAPEIEEARARVEASKAQYASTAGPGAPPQGRALVVMDAAAENSEIYLLIWPYHPATGPAVVRLNRRGAVIQRYRCRVESEQIVHKIAARDGALFLCSTRGRVFRFKL